MIMVRISDVTVAGPARVIYHTQKPVATSDAEYRSIDALVREADVISR